MKKRIEEVFTCCNKCKGIKHISHVPDYKCTLLNCNGNRKYKSFFYKGDKRKYVSNKSVRYRIISGRPTRSVNIGLLK